MMLRIKDTCAPGIKTILVMRYYRSSVTGSFETLGIYRDLTGSGSDGDYYLRHLG